MPVETKNSIIYISTTASGAQIDALRHGHNSYRVWMGKTDPQLFFEDDLRETADYFTMLADKLASRREGKEED